MEFNPDVSEFNLFVFTGLGVLLFLGMRRLKNFLGTSLSKFSRFEELSRLIPAFEGLTWLLFVLLAISLIFKDKLFYSVGILMVLVVTVGWLSWFFVRDFVAGMMLRSSQTFELGDRLRVQDFEGVLQRIGHFSMTLEGDDGQSTVIPFSTVSDTMLTRIGAGTLLKSRTFQVKITPEKSSNAIQQIRQLALIAPWTSIMHEPKIKFITENHDSIIYEVTVFGLEENYFRHIQKYLETHLEK